MDFSAFDERVKLTTNFDFAIYLSKKNLNLCFKNLLVSAFIFHAKRNH